MSPNFDIVKVIITLLFGKRKNKHTHTEKTKHFGETNIRMKTLEESIPTFTSCEGLVRRLQS